MAHCLGVEPDDEGPIYAHARPRAARRGPDRATTQHNQAADLCRARPAVFAAVVREADRLRAQGLSDEEALAQACGLDGPLLLAQEQEAR